MIFRKSGSTASSPAARPYGYSSFQCDLTPFIKSGGDNVIAVRVDHSRFADSRYYTGSGIYRNVRLVVADKLHVAHWGVCVTTPKVKTDSATVRIETTVENNSGAEKISFVGNGNCRAGRNHRGNRENGSKNSSDWSAGLRPGAFRIFAARRVGDRRSVPRNHPSTCRPPSATLDSRRAEIVSRRQQNHFRRQDARRGDDAVRHPRISFRRRPGDFSSTEKI